MKKLCSLLLATSFLLVTAGIAIAQDKPGQMHAPPPVLTITREFVRPGKSGAVHERSESAFVKAMTAGKSSQHYLALNSMSGKPRALFLTGYESFGDWEKQNLADMKNTTLSAELDRAALADGELLDAYDQSAWIYRDMQTARVVRDGPRRPKEGRIQTCSLQRG